MADTFTYDLSLPPKVRSDLQTYRTSVFAEMYYQKEHGRRYKVVNGSFLGRMSDGYAYCFDMESELFIADSSPVTVSHGGKSASGIVVACEDFQITVLLEQDIGEKLPVADIQVEPWKLLESLNARLAKMTSRNEIALTLMRDGPGLATSRPISDVATGQDTAKACVRNQPITVIWGPPGTGKTYTMAEIAISHITSGKRVLVVSHSNISVDGVVAKVAELMRARDMDRRLWRGDVMRFGHVRDDALAQDEDVVSYLHALGSDPDRKKELEGLYDERDRLRRASRRRTLDMANVQNKIRRLRASIDEDEKYCVGHARLVATTVSKLYANSFFEDRTYDLVMFDEVSMAYVPQVVCAAMHASERLVIVGDFRQLPPIVQSRGAKRELSRDIFTYLGIIGSDQVAHYHPWLVMLDEQRRMHPSIAAFSSYEFYDGLLKDHESVRESRGQIAACSPGPGKPMLMVSLRGTYCAAMRNSDNSRFNILSAVVCFGAALEAARTGASSVGIIAPYAAQVRLIRAMLRDWQERAHKSEREVVDIACSTVHQFQGSERDVIVLDMVESYPANKPGILMSSKENGSVDRLVNVAVTRARGKLVTVSNDSFWGPPTVNRDNGFSRLALHHRTFDTVVAARGGSLEGLLRTLDFGPNIQLFNPADAEAGLLHDVGEAAQKIVISLPDGKLEEPFEGLLAQKLAEAKARGVDVLMKCYNWKDLPESWRGFGWQSDDSIFPLVMVDGEICWYGLPWSRLRIPSKNVIAQRTTLRTPLRITGYATMQMIWSLTGIENRESGKNKQSLRAREDSAEGDVDGTAAYGLNRYILEHKKCPRCKGPMRIVKGYQSRKFSLKCDSCGQSDMLYRDELNYYISISHTKCPKCGAVVKAKVSRYGLYIECAKRHKLQPTEL
ncbi:MAG: AAA family ATPase [Atopobiaceae bacterium]|nr:AAA family ATPase [Atopobiaceae bacterium]